MEVYTIGFTKKSAAQFFTSLKRSGVRRLADIRLNNTSQLAGYAKRDDLVFFLKDICAIEYLHCPDLAPSEEILDGWKKKQISWDEYERRFLVLMAERGVEKKYGAAFFSTPTVLLCSEPAADKCHRRLVLEYLQKFNPDLTPRHLQ